MPEHRHLLHLQDRLWLRVYNLDFIDSQVIIQALLGRSVRDFHLAIDVDCPELLFEGDCYVSPLIDEVGSTREPHGLSCLLSLGLIPDIEL